MVNGAKAVRDSTEEGGATGGPLPTSGLRQAGPTVPRMTLGIRLRGLREASGLTRERASAEIGISTSKMSRLELGRTGCKTRDVEALLRVYGVADETECAMVRTLALEANTAGWWQSYGDVIPPWMHDYLGAEQSASIIRTFEVQYIPGLLQTAAYARAVIGLRHRNASPAELERRVELRVKRQRMLYEERPPHLWAVIDEAALRRPPGGAAVLREQLEHLLAVGELPHVTVQVLPFASGGHSALCGPITTLRLPGGGLPDVVFLEQLAGAVYPDRPDDLSRYWGVMSNLVVEAETADVSRALLRRFRDAL